MKRGSAGPMWRILLRVKWAPTCGIISYREFPTGDPCSLVKGQLRDVVKTGGNQPTYISMIHRRNLSCRASLQRSRQNM